MNKYLIISLSFYLYSINSFAQSDPYTPYLDIETSIDSTSIDNSDKLIEDLFSISLSDDELNEYIRSKAETAYHPCGTCKMGVDDMAVVDETLKVKGIKNLRVVDASIMPEIPSANLNAPTLMIAEKASDLIINSI